LDVFFFLVITESLLVDVIGVGTDWAFGEVGGTVFAESESEGSIGNSVFLGLFLFEFFGIYKILDKLKKISYQQHRRKQLCRECCWRGHRGIGQLF